MGQGGPGPARHVDVSPAAGDVLVVAVRAPSGGDFRYGPPAATKLVPDMSLVVLGRSEDVLRLQREHQLAPPVQRET